VDQHGNVLDILITDKLRSYGVAQRRVLRSVEHHRLSAEEDRREMTVRFTTGTKVTGTTTAAA
jgi:hypothetical protein